ncbi:DUF4097 family beta strand repeat-containing protein [Mycolicibacterium brisbanense]|uniref:DUF4097 domain-containing protein n=1 Tax=Mycolicibacterium brisbanense TaxID=146020 RepID=A0A100VUB5_9MYCO|nr:uncharacterized protein RMCB_0362 [Mycolicibacterium brisbanense]
MQTLMPPPIAAQPPQLSPGGRTAFRLTLIAIAALVVATTVAALGVTAWGVSALRVITDSQALPSAMRTLVVDTARIPVAIRITADRETREPKADLRLLNTTHSGAHHLLVSSVGGETRLTIAGNPGPMLEWARGGEITVALPPDQARRMTVRTEQDLGAVIAQADLDQLIARTNDGEIVLLGGARRIEVHTVDGEVITRDPIAVSEQFVAGTSDGDIAVDFRDTAPRSVEATTRNGNVAIGLPERGPYLVRAQSNGSTDVQVPETNSPEAAVAQITARSSNGDVVVQQLSLRNR